MARRLSGPLPASGWVTAYAPAGIGNFAAGFDLLGAALAPSPPLDGELWGDCVDVRRAVGREAGEGDRLECRGRFAHRLPAEPLENLVLKARDAFASRLAEPLPALDFVLHKNLPVASGLGSSASSVAATLVALNELLGQPLDDRALLAAAGEAEAQASGGVHLDNVAPALLGGLRLVDPESGSRALPFPEELLFVLWVPALELETRFARSVLPRELPLPDAIAWAQNLGALDPRPAHRRPAPPARDAARLARRAASRRARPRLPRGAAGGARGGGARLHALRRRPRGLRGGRARGGRSDRGGRPRRLARGRRRGRGAALPARPPGRPAAGIVENARERTESSSR